MNQNAILFLTHRSGLDVIGHYTKIKKECDNNFRAVFVYHSKNGFIPDNITKIDRFVFDDSILSKLGYKSFIDSLLPGSNHFPLLEFYLSNPEFDYYWVIEDDMRFNGDWNLILSTVDQLDHDFISTLIQWNHEYPTWHWWRTIAHPEKDIPLEKRIKSFNPIYRISNKALAFMHRALTDQWSGHHEVVLATLLYNNGFRIGDLGEGTFSINELKDQFYLRRTMHFQNPFKRVGNIPNKLYHPVKDFIE